MLGLLAALALGCVTGSRDEAKFLVDAVALEHTLHGLDVLEVIKIPNLGFDTNRREMVFDGLPDQSRHHEAAIRNRMVAGHYVGKLLIGVERDFVRFQVLAVNVVRRFHRYASGWSGAVVSEPNHDPCGGFLVGVFGFLSKESHAVKVEIRPQLRVGGILRDGDAGPRVRSSVPRVEGGANGNEQRKETQKAASNAQTPSGISGALSRVSGLPLGAKIAGTIITMLLAWPLGSRGVGLLLEGRRHILKGSCYLLISSISWLAGSLFWMGG